MCNGKMCKEVECLAHDVNNVMTIALGQLHLLEKKGLVTDSIRAEIEAIKHSILRAVSYCSDVIVDLTEEVDVEKLVDDFASQETGLFLFGSTKEPMILKRGKVKLTRIIENLVKNSIEAHATKAKITINKSVIEYIDNGQGFTSEQLKSIAKKDWFSTKGGGRGVGLKSIFELADKLYMEVRVGNVLMDTTFDRCGAEIKLFITQPYTRK